MRYLMAYGVFLTLVIGLAGPVSAEEIVLGEVGLRVPVGWEKATYPVDNTLMVLNAPFSFPGRTPHVQVTIQNSGNLGYEAYRDLSIKELEEMGLDGTSRGYKKFRLEDGSEAAMLIQDYPFSGDDYSTLSVWTMRKSKTYLMSFTTLASDLEKQRSTFLSIARSLRVR